MAAPQPANHTRVPLDSHRIHAWAVSRLSGAGGGHRPQPGPSVTVPAPSQSSHGAGALSPRPAIVLSCAVVSTRDCLAAAVTPPSGHERCLQRAGGLTCGVAHCARSLSSGGQPAPACGCRHFSCACSACTHRARLPKPAPLESLQVSGQRGPTNARLPCTNMRPAKPASADVRREHARMPCQLRTQSWWPSA